MSADLIVIGGGLVGAALAYGAVKAGRDVIVLDGEDGDLRAARANFGLIWVQGKGIDMPAYSLLSLESSEIWPTFLEELMSAADMRVDYARPGGLVLCLGEAEYQERESLNRRMHSQSQKIEAEMVRRAELERMLPAVKLGVDVTGASYCRHDGHVNPLQLLAALHRAVVGHGSQILFRRTVREVQPLSSGFEVRTNDGSIRAECVIVAAGLATSALTEPLGLSMPLRPERGQLLVTERLERILPMPCSGLRQTADGTVMIGATKEETLNRGVTIASATKLAARATRIIPALAQARIVRQWSGFRVMPPDSSPIYAESSKYPGLFAAACHSGVTLAAAHADIVAPAILESRLAKDLSAFSNGRFDVQKCA